MVSTYLCYLCLPNLRYSYRSQSSLVKYEKTKHQNNKIIPHLYTIIAPSSYDIEQFRNAFIIQVKKCLQFGRIYKEDGSGTVTYILMENKTGTYQINLT
ncbi:19244_t:CDS:2 [Racocetra fulgida]|uniref:19243_t:CDS:1 n=1 Tax=Racocetra fulgida TaxID=60492 RepID=A0A9N8VU65_9GLOM|nr:19243_t:CDS:2 [Racocetra fulgida]CAG8466505.1 19244_t:CDS:2 [Racocetra fulgida]